MHLIETEKARIPADAKIGLIIPGQPKPPAEPLKLILPEEKQVVDERGEVAFSMTWQHYAERRRFSCKPRQTRPPEGDRPDIYSPGAAREIRLEQIEDVVQATLEFAGEVGEVAEILARYGWASFVGDNRTKIIDECGDVLFCGAWLVEAWCSNPLPPPEHKVSGGTPELISFNDLWSRAVPNPLLQTEQTEFFHYDDTDPAAKIAMFLVSHNSTSSMQRDPAFDRFSAYAAQFVTGIMRRTLIGATLLSNSAKKLAFQRRERDPDPELARVIGIMGEINHVLCMANSTMAEAMTVNRAKIDKRYPSGYSPGVGGGIRTEG